MIKYILLKLVSWVMTLADAAIWIYVISSWLVNVHPTIWKINRFLSQIIEPLLKPVRKLLYPITMKIGLDFSPYVLAIAVSWVLNLVYKLIYIMIPF